jgi:hypothetical protein
VKEVAAVQRKRSFDIVASGRSLEGRQVGSDHLGCNTHVLCTGHDHIIAHRPADAAKRLAQRIACSNGIAIDPEHVDQLVS